MALTADDEKRIREIVREEMGRHLVDARFAAVHPDELRDHISDVSQQAARHSTILTS